MTKREIASLACKLLSVYAIINALGTLHQLFGFLGMSFGSPASSVKVLEPWTLFLVALPFVLLSTVAIFLWLLSDGLAVIMAPDDGPVILQQNMTCSLTRSDVLQLAFAIVGVLAVAQAVPVVVRAVVILLIPHSGSGFFQPATEKAYFFGALAQLAFGLYLLFGSRNLVRIVAAHAQPNDTTL